MEKQLVIPWNDGNGNIILTYTGQGDGTVVVKSDTDNRGDERKQDITIKTADGTVSVKVTVRQLSSLLILTTSEGEYIRDSEGNYMCVDASKQTT